MSTPEQTARFFETHMAVFQRMDEAQMKQMELVDAVIEIANNDINHAFITLTLGILCEKKACWEALRKGGIIP